MLSSISKKYLVAWIPFIACSCSLSDIVGTPSAPETSIGPDAVYTVAGALQLYNGMLDHEADLVREFVATTGLLTDELRNPINIRESGNIETNQRTLKEGIPFSRGDGFYDMIHVGRLGARDLHRILKDHVPILPAALQGRVYITEGLTHLMLAELYCSGVPLSSLNPSGGYTLQSGSSTTEILSVARALFDTAITLSGDSTRFKDLASILKARAFLGVGLYDSAAAAVEAVADTFVFRISYKGKTNGFSRNTSLGGRYSYVSVSDREGENGLPYVSSHDPRTDTVSDIEQTAGPYLQYVVKKYSDYSGEAPIVIASGVEARLIIAEAQLDKGNIVGMLRTLNALRTSCLTVDGCPIPAPKGTGDIAGLSPLSDPALDPLPLGKTAKDVRIDKLFEERAYWLFLTGHRQGDLRRLIRQYGRHEDTVYPTGAYPFTTVYGSFYGHDVTFPVPMTETQYNRKYSGCQNREA